MTDPTRQQTEQALDYFLREWRMEGHEYLWSAGKSMDLRPVMVAAARAWLRVAPDTCPHTNTNDGRFEQRNCPDCGGEGGFRNYTGYGDFDSETCETCGGKGWFPIQSSRDYPNVSRHPCSACDGNGFIGFDDAPVICAHCGGGGRQ